MKRILFTTAAIVLVCVGCGRSNPDATKSDAELKPATNATSNTQVAISPPKEQPPVASNAPSLPPGSTTGMGTGAAWSPLAVEVYREVTPEDGIQFYERFQSEAFRNGQSSGAIGYDCGVTGADGRKIPIELINTTVYDGQIQTKNLGILKREPGFNFTVKLFATESQIKKLRELQSGVR